MPLPIGCGQTISQPLVVARMCELLELRGDERVLDVGTGSGYHAALLARLAAEVYSIELHAELSERAARALAAAGAPVTLAVGDGSRGLPAHAPYDAINVAAAAQRRVPPALVAQLAPGGRLVAPVEEHGDQYLALLREDHGELRTHAARARALRAAGLLADGAEALVRAQLAPDLAARAPVDHHHVGGEVVGAAQQARADAVGVDRARRPPRTRGSGRR